MATDHANITPVYKRNTLDSIWKELQMAARPDHRRPKEPQVNDYSTSSSSSAFNRLREGQQPATYTELVRILPTEILSVSEAQIACLPPSTYSALHYTPSLPHITLGGTLFYVVPSDMIRKIQAEWEASGILHSQPLPTFAEVLQLFDSAWTRNSCAEQTRLACIPSLWQKVSEPLLEEYRLAPRLDCSIFDILPHQFEVCLIRLFFRIIRHTRNAEHKELNQVLLLQWRISQQDFDSTQFMNQLIGSLLDMWLRAHLEHDRSLHAQFSKHMRALSPDHSPLLIEDFDAILHLCQRGIFEDEEWQCWRAREFFQNVSSDLLVQMGATLQVYLERAPIEFHGLSGAEAMLHRHIEQYRHRLSARQ